jgi:hypothetical protein
MPLLQLGDGTHSWGLQRAVGSENVMYPLVNNKKLWKIAILNG